MIRIRGAISRGLRHPVLGPLLLLLIAVALVLIALHEVTEGWLIPLLAACSAAAFVAGLAVLRSPLRFRVPGAGPVRAPSFAADLDPPAPALVSLRL